jgi:carbamoyltransferase
MSLTAGLGGAARHGCVALVDRERVVGVCEQERVTRVRGAGFNGTGLPDEALDTLLERLGGTRRDVKAFATAESEPPLATGAAIERIDHHLAHACASYLSSPFTAATIVVCDRELPKVSVWRGAGRDVTRVDWPWNGPGFTDLYSECAETIGLASEGGGQRFEALARLKANHRDERIARLMTGDGTSLSTQANWQASARQNLSDYDLRIGTPSSAGLAAALQSRVGELFIEFLRMVRERTGSDALCLAGSFFHHSSINTLVKQSGLFARVHVPINPGNAGLAVGTALRVSGADPRPVTPFLGPSYQADEIKATLDNCKLRYDWLRDGDAIAMAVDAVRRGMLVGWFEGAMEWGPRALGGRCILANPFAPYVLENLNRFLKRREPWRGYALTGTRETVHEHFDGPDEAPYMECDYVPRDTRRFANISPSPDAAIRIQTVGPETPPKFRQLLDAIGAATGIPLVVNTSFNGFHEPIVCSPRDAVRVFYGSGLDVLILNGFVITK